MPYEYVSGEEIMRKLKSEEAMKPTIGRIVHYVSYGSPIRDDGSQAYHSECRAAIITEVDVLDGITVGLCVLNPTGQFYRSLEAGGCDYLGTNAHPNVERGGTWHWPERA
jgi:hypothetical protein